MTTQDILNQMSATLKDIHLERVQINDLETALKEAKIRRLAGYDTYDSLLRALHNELAPATYDFKTDTYTDKQTGKTDLEQYRAETDRMKAVGMIHPDAIFARLSGNR